LRMLRAVQFASRFGFLIEPDTMQMIRENAAAIREISGERILMEFDKIVQKGNVNTAANLLEESGLYEHIFGVKPGFASSYWMRQVKRMSEFIFLMVSLTNLDPDKFFRTNLKGDVDTSREIKALMKVRDKCNGMVECCWKIFHINKIAPQMTRTFIVTEMYRMDEVIKHMDAMNAPFSFRDLAITGDDLIAMGIPQGPKQGEILKNAVSAIFAGKLQNNKEALAQFAQGNTMNEQLEKMRRLL
jgi:tRNA nucleotidyltransferase/poly(A) polymerase